MALIKKYPNLFSTIELGPYTVKNRIEAAPIAVSDLTPDGYLTNEHAAFYGARAKGGAAIVTIGESLVDSKRGKVHGKMIPLDDSELMSSLVKTIRAIKRYGALASIELIHAGCRANQSFLPPGYRPCGPSSCQNFWDNKVQVIEMDEALIEEVAELFGRGAHMAQCAGADMCMLHGGHGWLLGQFLSPLNNKRRDRFGGNIENRVRFSLMVIDKIRQKCGKDFPIEFRMSGSELIDGGLTIEDSVDIAKILDGKVDLFHVSVASFHVWDTALRMFPSMFYPHGCNVEFAEKIKSVVKTPVVTVGGISNPAQMEEIIASGKADIISLGRALLADPDLPNKAKTGEDDDITHCLRCNNCISSLYVSEVEYFKRVLPCSVNPVLGQEYLFNKIPPADERKKVLVIGGGPAGWRQQLWHRIAGMR